MTSVATLAPRPRAILFDAGGTLLDELGNDLGAGVRTFLASTELADPTLAAHPEPFVEELERAVRIVRGGGEREFRLGEWLASRLEMSLSDASVAELAIWIGGLRLAPTRGIAEALDSLLAQGIRMAVVSNAMFSSQVLGYELGRFELLHAFEFVLTSADHGARKPSASIFREALERLGVEAEETWFVGDSWECDVVGAGSVGMRPFWVSAAPRPHASSDHVRIERAAEVANRIASEQEESCESS